MDIIETILPIFKELVMQYGLWETTLAMTLALILIVLAWRLPNIITALKSQR